jgi:hypothetical protein
MNEDAIRGNVEDVDQMRRAKTITDFVREPIGQLSLGLTHLVWCHSSTLAGSLHWGRFTQDAAADLSQRLAFSGHLALAGGFDVLMNAQAMVGFDWPAWEDLAGYVRSQLPLWNQRIRKHAVVVPQGMVGALVAGMLPRFQPHYALRFFDALADAVTWLERPELSAILEEVEGITAAAQRVTPILRVLREHLDHVGEKASIESAARAVGLSPRSLQRALKREGTSFTAELERRRPRS